jgi:hypothetical protein
MSATAGAGALSESQQEDLLSRMMYLKGEGALPLSMENQPFQRCGTPIAFDFFKNRENLTGKFAAAAAALDEREDDLCNVSFVSVSGNFRIHYTDTSSIHNVFMEGTDLIGFDGAIGADGYPDYINKIADIADSVWFFEIDSLGFPRPPGDSLNGGDSLLDIYVIDLGPSFYGVTYFDTTNTAHNNQSVPSYIVIDNDYNLYPYNTGPDGNTLNRRLDAARVTLAHEFFHTIHYGMDHSEYESQNGMAVVPWWEASSTWMEEIVFDDVNDYYAYLPYYYNYPWQGLRLVFGNGLHQYGACVFPLFLTQKYDTSLILDIWQICRDYGTGSQFVPAINDAILNYTGDTDSLLNAFGEFTIWNLFTGSRAMSAPVGYRFEEAESYSMIPDTAIMTFTEYVYDNELVWGPGGWPVDTLNDGTNIERFKNNMPQNLSAHYLHLTNMQLLSDTLFNQTFFGEPIVSWALSFIGFPVVGGNTATIIASDELEPFTINKFETDPHGYSSIMAIPSVAMPLMIEFSQKYGYTLKFNDSLSEEQSPVKLMFGPNPVIVESDNDSVNFIAEELTAIPRLVQLEVTLFNMAGEKIKELMVDGQYDTNYRISVAWYLENNEKKKVGPGVYMALMELKYKDGSPSVTRKIKLAVIK